MLAGLAPECHLWHILLVRLRRLPEFLEWFVGLSAKVEPKSMRGYFEFRSSITSAMHAT
jgi:hypothetical protein